MYLRIIVISIFLITAFLPNNAFASCEKYECEGVTNVVLISVKANSKGIFASFPEGTNETLSCSLFNKTDAKLISKSPIFKNMQSMLLTAVASNLPIKLSFSTESTMCKIESVEIKVVE